MVCSAYFEDNTVFNKSLSPPPYQSCTRSKIAFKPSHQLWKGKGGGGGGRGGESVAFDLAYAFAFIRNELFFESVSTFLQLLVV